MINIKNKNRLKVGIVGLGQQILNDHIPALLRRSDIQIVSALDTNVSAEKNLFQRYPELKNKTKFFQNLNDLVEGIDFAIVAIPHDQYFEVCKILCEKKIPFMKEKPFARNLEETIALSAIDNITSYCFICTQRRFHPLYNKASKLIKVLGKLGSFNATYTLNIPKPASGWRRYSEICGGGVVIDMGYHIIDQLIWWFGYPDTIYSKLSDICTSEISYDTEDSASIVFSYKKIGLQGSILLSRCTGRKNEGYQIAGSEYFMEGSKGKLIIKSRKDDETYLSEEEDCKEEMMDNQLAFFIDSIINNKTFEKNHLDNLLNMKFIECCYRNKITKDQALYINLYKNRLTQYNLAI